MREEHIITGLQREIDELKAENEELKARAHLLRAQITELNILNTNLESEVKQVRAAFEEAGKLIDALKEGIGKIRREAGFEN